MYDLRMLHVATWIEPDAWPAFERVFAAYPDVLLWNARTGMAPPHPHGLLLSGGGDVGPDFLRQDVEDASLIQGAIRERDAWEFYNLRRMLARRVPVLGVCRGLQVLNVALGGTLILDLPGHNASRFENVQPLIYTADARLRFPKVNSSHHQALGRLGDGLRVEATHADDGTIEQARLEGFPFVLAVQFHPERDEIYRPLFDAFIAAVRNIAQPAHAPETPPPLPG